MPPKPPELVAKQVDVGRRSSRPPRAARPDSTVASPPIAVRARDAQRLAGDGSNFEIELHLARRRPFERSPQPASQLGIVRLPDPLARLEREQVDIAAPKPKLDQPSLAMAAGGLFRTEFPLAPLAGEPAPVKRITS